MDGTIARQAMVNKLMARGVYTHPTIIDNVAAALAQCPEPPPSQVSHLLPLLACSLLCCEQTFYHPFHNVAWGGLFLQAET